MTGGPTERPRQPGQPGQPEQPLVDRVAAAVRSVPGVADLHAGSFGEVGTYLPGRRVAGIRLGDAPEIHVAVTFGSSLTELADAVRTAVAPLVEGDVRVVVEDVVPAGRG